MRIYKLAISTTLLFCTLFAKGTAQAQSTNSLTPAKIDSMIQAEWKKASVTPTSQASDAQYLRRIYLDILGTIDRKSVV